MLIQELYCNIYICYTIGILRLTPNGIKSALFYYILFYLAREEVELTISGYLLDVDSLRIIRQQLCILNDFLLLFQITTYKQSTRWRFQYVRSH